MLTCKPVIVASSLKLWVVEVLKFICFVSLDSTELPSTVQKKKIKEEEEGSGGKTGLCQSFFFFSGEVKSTSKELSLKCDMRSAQSGTGTCVLMWSSMSAAEARFLPPNTPRHKHAVYDLEHNKYGSKISPKGSEWRTQAAGGGSERGAMQTQTS